MINVGLVISEKTVRIVIGMTPFSKILQDSEMLLKKRLLGEKDRNTFEYSKSARFLYIVSLDTYNNFEMKVLFLQLRT